MRIQINKYFLLFLMIPTLYLGSVFAYWSYQKHHESEVISATTRLMEQNGMSFRESELTINPFVFQSELVMKGVEVEDPEYIMTQLSDNLALDRGEAMSDTLLSLLKEMNGDSNDLTIILASEEMSIETDFSDEDYSLDLSVYLHFDGNSFLEKGENIIVSDLGFNAIYESDDLSFDVGFLIEGFNQENLNNFFDTNGNENISSSIASRIYFDAYFYNKDIQNNVDVTFNDLVLTREGATFSKIEIDGSLYGSILKEILESLPLEMEDLYLDASLFDGDLEDIYLGYYTELYDVRINDEINFSKMNGSLYLNVGDSDSVASLEISAIENVNDIPCGPPPSCSSGKPCPDVLCFPYHFPSTYDVNIKADYSLSVALSEKLNEIILSEEKDYAFFSPGHERFNVEISDLSIAEDDFGSFSYMKFSERFRYEISYNDGKGIETGTIFANSRIDLEIYDFDLEDGPSQLDIDFSMWGVTPSRWLLVDSIIEETLEENESVMIYPESIDWLTHHEFSVRGNGQLKRDGAAELRAWLIVDEMVYDLSVKWRVYPHIPEVSILKYSEPKISLDN